jgi:glyoxylase-like metal-dependent hydrolase (beta-lactamase superfamily II)
VDITARPGHTGGDLVVKVADADVVFCGDLFWRRIPPNMIDGTTPDWISTLKALAAEGDQKTRYVPGHGEVADVGDVKDAGTYLEELRAAVQGAKAAGLSGAALAQRVEAELAPRYGAWTAFAGMSSREIPLMEQELADAKRRPVPAAD